MVWFIINRTTLGYELRSVGLNASAAEYGGINVKRSMVTSMGIAGGLAGAAGAIQVMGTSSSSGSGVDTHLLDLKIDYRSRKEATRPAI